MDKLQKLYTSIIDGKKQELQAKKHLRETEDEINRLLCLQLVNTLSWLTEHGLVPKLVKDTALDVASFSHNNKKSFFVQGWHVEISGLELCLYPIPGLPNEVFVTFPVRKGAFRYTLEELVTYIANHITVHI